jgi:hypothetical protein
MAKPRRISALSSVLKETQEYTKVTQESEQVGPVEQEIEIAPLEEHIPANTEGQKTVIAEKHIAVNIEAQKSVNAERQENTSTERQKSVERGEKLHKQTITINEHLALRLKVHAARQKETIASIATRAFEKLLAEEEEREISQL